MEAAISLDASRTLLLKEVSQYTQMWQAGRNVASLWKDMAKKKLEKGGRMSLNISMSEIRRSESHDIFVDTQIERQ